MLEPASIYNQGGCILLILGWQEMFEVILLTAALAMLELASRHAVIIFGVPHL
jgi:hypothetical protein